MRSDTTGYVEAELPQRGFLRLVLQLGLECSRLLQIEAPARQSRPDEHTSRDHLVLRQRAAPRSPLLDLQDAWQLYGGHSRWRGGSSGTDGLCAGSGLWRYGSARL